MIIFAHLLLHVFCVHTAGLGIFTGIDLAEGEAVAEPDIIIPLADYEWHSEMSHDFHLLWGEYSWQPQQVKMETDMVDGSALVIGTGCMPNCNFALINAFEGKPEYGHAGLSRKDHGVTGFTGYYNQRMITLRDIPAGGEIFVDYGEQWFVSRGEPLSTVPFEVHFGLVDEFLVKFKSLCLTHQTADNPDFTKDLWDAVKAEARAYETRSGAALPLTFDDMQSAQAVGSAESRLHYSLRTIDWLNQNGRCMDNIRPGNSTIKDAGRGAFASRFIPKGGLVAPGPVLHIPNSTALDMYQMDPATGNRDLSKLDGKQLILNYCFGHRKSTLLLCPYTSPSAYINHNRKKANARIVWANEGTTPQHNAEWLKWDIDDLKQQEAIGLSLNFIATRNIQPGEEVFIDYGKEWEAAWKKYVKEWKPPADSDSFVSATALQTDFAVPLRTIFEEEEDKQYPDNFVFYCTTSALGVEDFEEEWFSPLGQGQWEYAWDDSEHPYEDEYFLVGVPKYPCKIISRSDDPGTKNEDGDNLAHHTYSAVLLTEDELIAFKDEVWVQQLIPKGVVLIIHDIPRFAIEVRDKMYTKNEFLSGSFRHPMMIPDDIFPETWMNL